MCGLSGVYRPTARRSAPDPTDVVAAMTERLHHRGPDGAGIWSDPDAGLTLGHRRLAIIDLSPAGAQPMLSADGRFVLVLNGEIYNFRALRRELEAAGRNFRGHADTEVLLRAIEHYGLDATLPKLIGMFAFALFDRATRVLHLVRDRLGKKPLYVGRVGDSLAFASELKALAVHPEFTREVDRGALALFLRYQYIPAPHTIWRGVIKLPAGTRLSLRLDGREDVRGVDLAARLQTYWSAKAVVERCRADPLALGEAETLDQVERTLRTAVRERMIADVPLGAMLSGGIDSALVVALMQQETARPVRTFTIGFDDDAFDEAAEAGEVARHIGTAHTELRLTPAEARQVIPRLPEIYDEPFADASAIPTFCVARLARSEVTVALSGDGGDELFAGYSRYLLAARLEDRLQRAPAWLRASIARLATTLPPGRWDRVLGLARPGAIEDLRGSSWSGDRVHKLAGLVETRDPDARYHALVNATLDPGRVVIGAHEPPTAFTDPARGPQLDEYVHRMMYYDLVTYLPDDILTKVDRASMAVSLEVRAPLLDHRLLELAWRLPLADKLRDGEGKWLLRRLADRHLPAEARARPKRGFGVPLADWMRGPLRGWAEDLLDARRLAAEGFLDPEPMRRSWCQHLSGERNWSAHLWSVLMFQAWQERWLQGRSA